METTTPIESRNAAVILSSIGETKKKISSTLALSVEEHTTSDSFDHKTDSLDFLETKNSLMLSYLIDLTQLIRLKTQTNNANEEELKSCFGRLQEMRVTLEKARPLEKKMRYSLDKLLALSATSSAFALGETKEVTNEQADDPLSYRPNLDSLAEKDSDDDGDNSGNEDSSGENSIDSSSVDSEDDDDELKAAKTALKLGKGKKSAKKKEESDDDDDNNDDEGVYKAPRMVAVPFEEKEKQAEKEERLIQKQRNRMRKSELLSTLKANYGDAPEEDDFGGGAILGTQREASRRLAERDLERTKFEEEQMIRMTTSRKEKKLKNRIMRDEISNLNAIADLGNLTAGVSVAFGDNNSKIVSKRNDDDDDVDLPSRYANGKRRRSDEFGGGKSSGNRRPGKNSLQKTLYGTNGGGKKRKK